MEWKRIKDDPPDHKFYPPVICGNCDDAWSDAAYLDGRGRWFNMEGVEVFPTHWQPLPEPPTNP